MDETFARMANIHEPNLNLSVAEREWETVFFSINPMVLPREQVGWKSNVISPIQLMISVEKDSDWVREYHEFTHCANGN